MSILTPRLDRLDKNLLINGNLDFWQRGTNFTTAVYTADRWKQTTAGATLSRQTASGIPGAKYVLQVAATAQTIAIEQRIESNMIRHLEGKEVTLSVKAKATSGTPTLSLQVYHANAEDNWSTSTLDYTQSLGTLTSSFVTYSHTFTVTASMAANGFNILLTCGSTTATVQFGQAMLNVGDQVNEFNFAGRNHAEELALCQRYYEKSYDLDVSPGTPSTPGGIFVISISTISGCAVAQVWYKSIKRAIPIVTFYNSITGATGTFDRGGTPITFGISAASNGTSGFNVSNTAVTNAVNGHSGQWAAEAELT